MHYPLAEIIRTSYDPGFLRGLNSNWGEDKMNPEERINAVWCVDSETGEKVLIDRLTNKIISRGEQVMEPTYPVLTEAEATYQQAYNKGRADEAALVEDTLAERDRELCELADEVEKLRRDIRNFLVVGAALFRVELTNEQ